MRVLVICFVADHRQQLAARYMRDHAADFLAFAEMDAAQFAQYCTAMETGDDWGGQASRCHVVVVIVPPPPLIFAMFRSDFCIRIWLILNRVFIVLYLLFALFVIRYLFFFVFVICVFFSPSALISPRAACGSWSWWP